MKPLYVRVVLFDPVSDEGFPVSDGIQVDVVKINDFNPLVGFNRRSLKYNSDNDLFTVKAPRYHVSQSHYLRVGFKKVNFSKITGQLMATGDVENSHLPVYCPARLPYWDSGWEITPPAWLAEENPYWPSNYKVRYWQQGWQDIIFGNDSSYLKKILDAGFDGVYLDIIDAFEYFE